MELQPVTAEDVALYEAIHCDPAMMAHLGGPFPPERAANILRSALGYVERGQGWVFKVMAATDAGRAEAAGTVCLWESEYNGQSIDEIGWTILPPFQGRGLASQATRVLLERARAEHRFGLVHAFPATSNQPSNALCKTLGFARVEECEVDFAGRTLHCNHWTSDLRASDPGSGVVGVRCGPGIDSRHKERS